MVVINGQYISIPKPAWEKFGSPAKVSVFFNQWDVLVVPSDELKLTSSKYTMRVPMHNRNRGLADYLNVGSYPVCVDKLVEIKFLRIEKAAFTCVDKQFATHWKSIKTDRQAAN